MTTYFVTFTDANKRVWFLNVADISCVIDDGKPNRTEVYLISDPDEEIIVPMSFDDFKALVENAMGPR